MRAFGFEVLTLDVNDMDALDAAFARARAVKGKPTVLVARTTKGKGVGFMENKAGWHGKAPNDEQYAEAVGEILRKYHELGGDGDV
jgi:transketolase